MYARCPRCQKWSPNAVRKGTGFHSFGILTCCGKRFTLNSQVVYDEIPCECKPRDGQAWPVKRLTRRNDRWSLDVIHNPKDCDRELEVVGAESVGPWRVPPQIAEHYGIRDGEWNRRRTA